MGKASANMAITTAMAALASGSVGTACAQEGDNDLAKKLSNPVAAMISLPLQFNYDSGYGPEDGYRFVLNVQPVVPISLNDEWNAISRTIIPVIQQNDIVGPSGTQFGMGDITQSFWLSPAKPGSSGIIWGVGPVFLLPTATDDMLGAEKFGVGPTAIVLKQIDGWTIGGLANHIWSVAGDDSRPEISSTFLQPFVSYTTPTAWTFSLNTESSYDWNSDQWSVPINASVSKLVKFGQQPVSLSAGVRYWAEAPDGGPEGVAFRAGLTFLFPK
jgi:hypothetical protein